MQDAEQVSITVRMEAELVEKVRKLAEADHRTFSGQVRKILMDTLKAIKVQGTN